MDSTTDTSARYYVLPLGHALPPSPHAVSVSMPRWGDVVDYERGEPRVLHALEGGYPRFVLNRYVEQLIARVENTHAAPGEKALVFPTHLAATRCAAYVLQQGFAARVQVHSSPSSGEVFATLFPQAALRHAMDVWQHAGTIVSSRRAQAFLEGRAANGDSAGANERLRRRVAELAGVDGANVFLFPTGMAAVAAAHTAVCQRRPDTKTVQAGFPYVDTLKVQEKLGPGALRMLTLGDAEHDRLARILQGEPAAGIFTEVPTNPLMQTADLDRLRTLSLTHGTPLVVDDSINCFVSHDFSRHADMVVASLTKYFGGTGDAMAGVLVTNPQGPWHSELQSLIREDHNEDALWADDAARIESCCHDVATRIARVSQTAEALCDFLKGHSSVGEVHYPKFSHPERYVRCRRPDHKGFGGMFSFVLKDTSEHATAAVFDALPVAKGPSFGTNFTLACPYTILAHYHELPWAATCGLPARLIRVSVGLEDSAALIERFSAALRH